MPKNEWYKPKKSVLSPEVGNRNVITTCVNAFGVNIKESEQNLYVVTLTKAIMIMKDVTKYFSRAEGT